MRSKRAEVKMEKEDGLPQHGCLCCIQKLESVVTFMKQCEDSDRVLRKNLDTDHFKQGDKVNFRDLIQDIKSFSLDYSSDDQNQCSNVYIDDFAYNSTEDITNKIIKNTRRKKDANTNENVTNKKVTEKNDGKIDDFLANNDVFAYGSMEDITNTRVKNTGGRRKKVCKKVKKDANINENIRNKKVTEKNDGKIDNFLAKNDDFAYDSMEDITNNDDFAYDSMEDIKNNDDFAYDSMEDNKNNVDFAYDSMEDITNKILKNTRGTRKKVCKKVKKDANTNENITNKKDTEKKDGKIDNFWASNGEFAYDSMEDITNNDDFAYDSIEDITSNDDFAYDSIKDITNKGVKNTRGRKKKVSKRVKKDTNTNENITNKKITKKNDCKIDDFWAEFDIEPVSDKNTEIPTGDLCHHCGKEFPPGQRNSYRNHIENYHSEKKFKCDKCHQAFFTKLKLEGHQFNYHQKEGKRFACDMCDQKYASSNKLRIHKESIHLKSITYECDLCSKVFYNKIYFKVHQKRHTTEGEPKCTLCNKVCCNKSALNNHMRSHTGERPFNCRFCDSKFITRQSLKEHERLHTGEKPFKCPACQKGFSQRGNMKSHFKHNHRKLDFKKTQEAFRLSLKKDKETDEVSNDAAELEIENTNGES